jgi:hypothetical protein
MIKKLFIITKMSDLLMGEILTSKNKGELANVLTTEVDSHNKLLDMGVKSFLCPHDKLTQKEHDRKFAKDFMPGILGNSKFYKTDLNLSEVLSIDRLRFWYYYGERLKGFIDGFSPDAIVASLDIYAPYLVPREFEGEVVLVKTHEIIDPIMRDIIPFISPSKIIVSTDREAEFLRSISGERIEIVSSGIQRQRPVISPEVLNAYRKRYFVPEQVIAVHQQYDYLLDFLDKGTHHTLCAVSPNVEETIYATYLPKRSVLSFDVATKVSDKFVFLGFWDESLYWQLPEHISIYVFNPFGNSLVHTLPLPEGVTI